MSEQKPILYLICGCSGVGKTHFATSFAKEKNIVYLGADDFYAKINGSELIRTNKFKVWQALFSAIHELENEGKSCVVDTNGLSAASRDEFLNWFPSFEHHLIYIEAPEELRQSNNLKRERQVPQEAMTAMFFKAEVPNWTTLDKRWLSLTKIYNQNNEQYIVAQYGV